MKCKHGLSPALGSKGEERVDREAAGQVSLPQLVWRSLKAMTTASSQIEGAAKALDSSSSETATAAHAWAKPSCFVEARAAQGLGHSCLPMVAIKGPDMFATNTLERLQTCVRAKQVCSTCDFVAR